MMKNNPKHKIEKPKPATDQSKQSSKQHKPEIVLPEKKSELPKPAVDQPKRTKELPGQASERPSLPGVFTMGLRHPKLVLGLGLLCALASVWLATQMPFSYKATARLYVDPRDLKVLENQVTPTAEAQNIGVTLVETQALVLGSGDIRKRAVEKLKLGDDPEFNGQPRGLLGSLASSAKSFLASIVGEKNAPGNPNEIALDNLARAISVYRIDRSYVIEVSARAESGEKARAIVDSLVTFYLDDQSRWRADVAKRTSQDLGAGVQPLRENVKKWEQRVARYKQDNNLIDVRGLNTAEQQFADLNTQLVKARVEATQLKARFESTPTQARDLGMVPEAVNSNTLRDLRVLRARARQRSARFRSQLGPRHPVMRSMASSEGQLTQQIDAELSRIRESIGIQYRRASAGEAALATKLQALGSRVTQANTAQIALRELEREMEVARSAYNKAITRAKEADQQARLDTTNVRVISPANRERGRVFPPPLPLVGVIGFLLGTILALFFLHWRGLVRQARAE